MEFCCNQWRCSMLGQDSPHRLAVQENCPTTERRIQWYAKLKRKKGKNLKNPTSGWLANCKKMYTIQLWHMKNGIVIAGIVYKNPLHMKQNLHEAVWRCSYLHTGPVPPATRWAFCLLVCFLSLYMWTWHIGSIFWLLSFITMLRGSLVAEIQKIFPTSTKCSANCTTSSI